MGPAPIKNVPCAKGALCYCLDEFSKGSGARSRIAKLRDAIAALAPSYAGLTDVFDRYLVSHVISDAEQRQRIAANLNAFWLDPGSRKPFFPAEPMAEILREGHTRDTRPVAEGEGAGRPDQRMVGARLGRAQNAEHGRCQRRRNNRRQRHPAHHDVAAEGARRGCASHPWRCGGSLCHRAAGPLVTTRRVRDMA